VSLGLKASIAMSSRFNEAFDSDELRRYRIPFAESPFHDIDE
jgi:hypothetical protein